jgi:uncharacterized protein (TIGR03437 family)
VFERFTGLVFEIHVMNADGSNQTRLTNGFDEFPRWSPDGTRVVFQSFRGGHANEIYVMNADGTNQTRLTKNLSDDDLLSPIFSPDGTRIAFLFASTFGGEFISAQISVMNADGSNPVKLTNTYVGEQELDWQALLHSVATVAATNYSPDALTSDGIAALFGSDLATTTASASSLTLPVTLGGIQVLLRDAAGTQRAAGLFYVSPTQINFHVPTMTVAGDAVLIILRDGATVGQGTAEIHRVAPTWFTANTDGTGLPAALVQRITSTGMTTYEPVAEWDAAQSRYVGIPIDLGTPTDTVTFVGFGCGFRNRSSLSAVSAAIGGINVEVLYASAQGTYVGLDQGNIRIPPSLAGRGNVELEFTVDGRKANPVMINIK